MLAEALAQRLVHQVGGGVVGPHPVAALGLDRQLDRVADREPAAREQSTMREHVAKLALDVEHGNRDAGGVDRADRPGIPDLATGLAVERGLVDDHQHLDTGFGAVDRLAVDQQRRHLALGLGGVVAEELGGPGLLANLEPDGVGGCLAGAGPGLARRRPLALHRRVETLLVEPAALAAQDVGGQIDREAVGVVELEGDLTRQPLTLAELAGGVLQVLQAAPERVLEAGLLELQGAGDQRLGADQFGIGLTHGPDQRRHQAVHQRVGAAHDVGVAHGAPHDPAQHVAAALVRRQHAVGDQERTGAQVVGHHPVRDLERPVGIGAGGVRRGLDQAAHGVGVVVVVLALQHRGDPLQPHAGVDRRPRQAAPLLLGDLLELHEHQVPDLDEPVAVLVGRSRRAAGNLRAVVEEDLAARPARAGVAHRPEIVGGRDPDDPFVRQPGDLAPERRGVLVLAVDGDQQAVLRQPELPGDQGPGVLDGVLLEVVAEREIAEHLEERVMAGGVPDVLQVVVLAAGAHAFLRGGGARVVAALGAGEDVLELHHPGVGEHQRRIVARDQRRGLHDGVVAGREVVQERASDVVRRRHGESPASTAPAHEGAARPDRAPA